MMLLSACKGEQEVQKDTFDYTVEQFADLQLLRYKVHGFEALRFNLNLGTDYVKSNSDQ